MGGPRRSTPMSTSSTTAAHAAEEGERLRVALVVFDAARSCRSARTPDGSPRGDAPDRDRGPGRPLDASMTDEGGPRPPTGSERTARQDFRVRFEEAGPSGTIRASVLLRYAAELAWVHSERRGFARSWYRERDLAWLVRGVDLRLLRPIDDGSTIEGTTIVGAARKVIARRRTEFRTAGGALAAVLDVDWAMTTPPGLPTGSRMSSVPPSSWGRGRPWRRSVSGRPHRPDLVERRGPARDGRPPPRARSDGTREQRRLPRLGGGGGGRRRGSGRRSARRWRFEFQGAAGPTSRIGPGHGRPTTAGRASSTTP